jgi:hypothetical protein
LCGKFLRFVLKYNIEKYRAFFAGTSGRGNRPFRSAAFLRKEGVEGGGVPGQIGFAIKQTHQKKKGRVDENG